MKKYVIGIVTMLLILTTISVTGITYEGQLLQEPTTLLNFDWVITAENTTADPGATNHVIGIYGSWARGIGRFRYRIHFDPEVLEFVEVNEEGCVAEGDGSLTVYENPDYITVYHINIHDIDDAGAGKLSNLVFNISEYAWCASELHFNADQSYYFDKQDHRYYPKLNDGLVFIGVVPPEAPERPSGETEGLTFEEYTYTTSTTDANGGNISYWFDWGNGENSGWTEPYPSGELASASYAWPHAGTYNVSVKAKDEDDFVSDFSEELAVTIERKYKLEIATIGGLLGVVATINNTGGADANDSEWEMELDGGLILLGKETNGTVDVKSGESSMIRSIVFGFGKTEIALYVKAEGTWDRAEATAFILGPLVLSVEMQ